MPHARVDIPLKHLQASLHGLTATTLLLVDPDSPGKRLGESHGTLVPFSADVDADALTFLLNMPAKAHRRLEIYQLQSPGFVPAFEKRTDILEEQAYRASHRDRQGCQHLGHDTGRFRQDATRPGSPAFLRICP
jgi:hypothetical protein